MINIEQGKVNFQTYLDTHIIKEWKDNYIPYEAITKNTSIYYMKMLKDLEKENKDSEISYYGTNKCYDEFIENYHV